MMKKNFRKINLACKIALTPPKGPVSIEIPIDIQRKKIKDLLC